MVDTSQTLYRKSLIRFARAIRLKFSADAQAMNNALLIPPDENKPETWPYYLNLAGKYHSTNTMMRVISLDTREEIDFTYNNLLEHRATHDAYQIGKPDYYELLSRYPDQEILIKGILDPIPFERAYAARDFEILSYAKDEIEPQEITVIPELQARIDAMVTNGYFKRYNLTQELYPAGFLVVLGLSIPVMLQNIRKKRTRTSEVHSFHLWSYLGSHGRLNIYRDQLNLKQAHWLYQQIVNIENNPGHTETFDELIYNLLTERGIPLVGYDIWHNTEGLPDTIYPDVSMSEIPLNYLGKSSSGVISTTVERVLEKELPLAPNNIDYYPDKLESIPEKVKISEKNKLETKVLESEMDDRTDSLPVTWANTVLNHWIYWSAKNNYIAAINVVHPLTQEVLTMTPKESVIVWLYCQFMKYGMEDVIDIPTVKVTNVQVPQIPTYADLRGSSQSRHVTPDMIYAMIKEYTPINKIISIQTFYEKVQSVHNNQLAQWYMFSKSETMRRRGELEMLSLKFKMSYRCTLTDSPMSFLQYFKLKSWKLDGMTTKSYEVLGDEIFRVSTGSVFREKQSLAEMQRAMIAIMSQLSSYSIQFIRKINEEPVKILNLPIVRFSDEETKNRLNAMLKIGIKMDAKDRFKVGHKAKLDMSDLVDFNRVGTFTRMRYRMSSDVDFTTKVKIKYHHQIKIPRVVINMKMIPNINDVLKHPLLEGVFVYEHSDTGISDTLMNSDLGSVKTYQFEED